jgi:uncharacterized protein
MAPGPHEDLRGRLRRALPAAMKARDAPAVAALRSALAAIDNAEAIEVAGTDVEAGADGPAGGGAEAEPGAGPPPFAGTAIGVGAAEAERRRLTSAQMEEIVRAEMADRQAAALTYEEAGQLEQAERLRTEARILGAYLSGGEPRAE